MTGGLLPLERRWARALMGAMLPATPGGGPGIDALDLEPFWSDYERTAPPLVRLGLRASIWILTWLPLLSGRGLRPFHRLPAAQRDRLLCAWSESRWYLLRQLVMTVKVIVCFAAFRDPEVRRASWRRAGLEPDAGFSAPKRSHHAPGLRTQSPPGGAP